jgi:type IV secretion system protein VirB1
VILPLAAIAHLATACAPQVAPATLEAVAKTESGFDALAVHDNATGRTYQPASTDQAVGLARQLIAAGHSVDAGLLQINNHNFEWLGLTVATAFDPCRSIAAAATLLTAISRYNTGSPRAGFTNGYVDRVLDAQKEGKEHPTPATASSNAASEAAQLHRWNAFPDPAEDNWNQ